MHLTAVGSERADASAWVPTDVVTQLDFICLLHEKKLANMTATLEELGLAKVRKGGPARGREWD